VTAHRDSDHAECGGVFVQITDSVVSYFCKYQYTWARQPKLPRRAAWNLVIRNSSPFSTTCVGVPSTIWARFQKNSFRYERSGLPWTQIFRVAPLPHLSNFGLDIGIEHWAGYRQSSFRILQRFRCNKWTKVQKLDFRFTLAAPALFEIWLLVSCGDASI
jgi:hypothetical protein